MVNLFEQARESGLLEVMVGGEGVGHVALLHKGETRAVGQTPILIRTRFEQLPCRRVKRFVDMDNFDIRRGLERINKAYALMARNTHRAVEKRNEFGDDVICRDEHHALRSAGFDDLCGKRIEGLRDVDQTRHKPAYVSQRYLSRLNS